MVNVVRLIPPKPPGPPVTLINDCCLNAMRSIESGSVDLVLCDPPYGTTACKWDSVIPLDLMWKELKRVAKIRSPILIFGTQPYSSVLVTSNLKMFKHNWIWEKSRSGSAIAAKYGPVKIHEDILVFCCSSPNYYPIMEVGEPYSRKSKYNNENHHKFGIAANVETTNDGTRFPKTIRFEKQDWSKQQQIHPTQKPVALMEYLIKTYSNEGDTVLDFAMGSGTTGVACKNLNRKFIGIEKDSEYFRLASERIDKA